MLDAVERLRRQLGAVPLERVQRLRASVAAGRRIRPRAALRAREVADSLGARHGERPGRRARDLAARVCGERLPLLVLLDDSAAVVALEVADARVGVRDAGVQALEVLELAGVVRRGLEPCVCVGDVGEQPVASGDGVVELAADTVRREHWGIPPGSVDDGCRRPAGEESLSVARPRCVCLLVPSCVPEARASGEVSSSSEGSRGP